MKAFNLETDWDNQNRLKIQIPASVKSGDYILREEGINVFMKPNSILYSENTSDASSLDVLKIINRSPRKYPSTGGSRTFIFPLMGMCIIGIGAYIYHKKLEYQDI